MPALGRSLICPVICDIRGAAFGPDGRLWVVDAQANEVFAIDASTGTIDAASIQGLNKNGEAFDLSDASDIAFRANGTAQDTLFANILPAFNAGACCNRPV